MSLMMILFWGGLASLIVWAIRSSRGSGASDHSRGAATPTPDDILAERFARGEIDADEFQRSRDLLTSTSTQHT